MASSIPHEIGRWANHFGNLTIEAEWRQGKVHEKVMEFSYYPSGEIKEQRIHGRDEVDRLRLYENGERVKM